MCSDESHFNVSVGSDGQSHKTVSTNHNFWREMRAEAVSNQGPSAYQPNALPLGQTGCPPYALHPVSKVSPTLLWNCLHHSGWLCSRVTQCNTAFGRCYSVFIDINHARNSSGGLCEKEKNSNGSLKPPFPVLLLIFLMPLRTCIQLERLYDESGFDL